MHALLQLQVLDTLQQIGRINADAAGGARARVQRLHSALVAAASRATQLQEESSGLAESLEVRGAGQGEHCV